MSDIKWIKIVTDIFDDEKILLIESMPDADTALCLWFKLLCLAGKTGTNGVLMLNNRIAFTDEMLATIFRRPINTVRMALRTFQRFEMIEIVEGVITIPNWPKHQNLDAIETKREYQRAYMAKRREEQRLQASNTNQTVLCKSNGKTNSNANSKSNVSYAEGEEEREKERELRIHMSDNFVSDADAQENQDQENDQILEPRKQIPYKEVAKLWNEQVKSLPAVTEISDRRKQAIKSLMAKGVTLELFAESFKRVEASDFLTGRTEKPWTNCGFDWILKQANWTKLQEGNYDNKGSPNGQRQQYRKASNTGNFEQRDYEPGFLESFYEQITPDGEN